jgi:glycosyltransferase involved in cell wall biosynthesis
VKAIRGKRGGKARSGSRAYLPDEKGFKEAAFAVMLHGIDTILWTGFSPMRSHDLAVTPHQRVLLHIFPTFSVGGSQTRFAAIANHFGSRYRHLIVALDGNAACAERLAATVDFEVLSVEVRKNRTLANYVGLRRQLARLRPDILVTYNWGSIEWGLANLPPLCGHIHIEDGFGPDEAGGQLRRRVLMRRLVLSPWARVVLPSRMLYRIAAEQWRLPRRRLNYIPNGIDCDRFASAPDPEISAKLRRRPDELLVGTVAALRAEKNLSRLIAAFAQVNAKAPARLVIVGDGVERPKLEALVAEHGLGDSVVFTGPLRAPEHLLGALDLFALSSDTEQMPYSVLEAMGAGLPIASVDVGDVKEMVAPENRALVVPRTPEALAGAIEDLLHDQSRRVELGRANAARVRGHFSQETMFAAYGLLFDA